MFEDYKKALLDFYLKKKENKLLTTNLENPGRDKLKKECVEVFLKKNTQRDKDFIRSIFDPTNKYEDQVRSIEKFKVDKLRPLVNFLTEGTSIREEKFVKLLGWLLDFPAYDEWRELSEEELKLIFENAAKKPEEKEQAGPNIPELIGDVKAPDVISTPPPPTIVIIEHPNEGGKGGDTSTPEPELPEVPTYIPRFSPRYITISCIILLILGTTSFAIWERLPTTVRIPEKGEKFMYWDDDHYESVKDEKQDVGAAIIPLNIKTLTQQQKITLPDTLTSYSIGKVWYKGHGKDHEFFTAAGVYPPDTVRTLKKLSPGILRDYVSYYRYLLTRLVWFLCAAFFVGLCGFAASKLEKEVKSEDKLQENDIKETLSASEATQVMNETEFKAVQV